MSGRSSSRRQRTSGHGGGYGGRGYGSSAKTGSWPSRHKILTVILALAIALMLFCAVDAIATGNRIHARVSIAGLDLGGMTVEEAATAIDEAFSSQVSDGQILLYEDEESVNSDSTATEITFDYETLQSYETTPPEGPVFSIDPTLVGAYVDSEALAQQAYEIGRGWNFIFGRLATTLFGASIDLRVSMEDTNVEALASILDNALGQVMVNPNITFSEGTFTTTSGNDGYMVVRDSFTSLLETAMLSSGDERYLVVPMEEVKTEVTDEDAQEAAEIAQAAISESVEMTYESSASWTLDSDFLGQSISTFVRTGLFGNNSLIPYVSSENLETLVSSLEGMEDVGTAAQNVHFTYDGETLEYTEAQTGIGPNYIDMASQLNSIMFSDSGLCLESGEITQEEEDESKAAVAAATGEDQEEEQSGSADADAGEEGVSREVTMTLATSYPDLTYDDAVELGLTSNLISSYTTQFNGTGNKIINIKLLADILTNTVVAPGETFSLNDTAGECNAEKGFQEAGTIINGRVESEIGGGICQVATTVYDAAFFAGYPIDERHNHSNYVSTYEDGMDAAIAYPYFDLKFTNDTNNYMIILVDYDDYSVTCSLWGIDPGYTVEYEMTSWEEGDEYTTEREYDETLDPGTEVVVSSGLNGHSVTIMRWVYSSDGSLIREESIVSNYSARTQVVSYGPEVSDTSSDDESTDDTDDSS